MTAIKNIMGRRTNHIYLKRIKLLPKIFGWRLWLHIFHNPDDDSNFHDHPFDFYTMPLWPIAGYIEENVTGERFSDYEHVPAWNWTKRHAKHQHRVGTWSGSSLGKKLFTLVWHGPNTREWGFWVKKHELPRFDKDSRHNYPDAYEQCMIDGTKYYLVPWKRYTPIEEKK